MALIHADGFDHYGTVFTNAQPFGWSQAIVNGGAISIGTTAQARTGTGYLALRSGNSDGGFSYCYYTWSGTQSIIRVGAGLASADNGGLPGIGLYATDNTSQIIIRFTPEGAIQVYVAGTLVATSQPGLYKFDPSGRAYNYVELYSGLGVASTGFVIVRINNIVVLTVNGLTMTAPNVAKGFGRVGFSVGQGGLRTLAIDDFVINDDSGGDVETIGFMGDKRCRTSYATSDEPSQMWTPSTGVSNYPLIAKNNPLDTTYISGANAGDVSQFTIDPVPSDTVSIAGVVIFSRCSKSDAGPATMGVGINSGAFTDLGDLIGPGTGFAGYRSIIAKDPDGDIPWTYPKYNAAKIRAERIS